MGLLNRVLHPFTWLKWRKQTNELPDKTKPGLEVKFVEGEKIPLKGIWFNVQIVQRAALVLVPQAMTWKQAKKIKGLKNE